MTTLEAVVLGIVQGLTEFLPISSSGHLRIVPALLGWEDPGAAFTAVTQLGTVAAVLLYFRREIGRILGAWVRGLRDPVVRRSRDSVLGWYIAAGTIPIGVFGFVFRHQIERGARSLELIGSMLIVFGLVMLAAERLGTRDRGEGAIRLGDALAIGAAQAVALIPGVSRSGATISTGLLLGLDRAAAARFSFLLSVPAVVISGVFEARTIGDPGGAGLLPTLVATALAFVTGYASIAFLLRYLVTHTVNAFVVYRLVLGVLVLVLAATDTIR